MECGAFSHLRPIQAPRVFLQVSGQDGRDPRDVGDIQEPGVGVEGQQPPGDGSRGWARRDPDVDTDARLVAGEQLAAQPLWQKHVSQPRRQDAFLLRPTQRPVQPDGGK